MGPRSELNNSYSKQFRAGLGNAFRILCSNGSGLFGNALKACVAEHVKMFEDWDCSMFCLWKRCVIIQYFVERVTQPFQIYICLRTSAHVPSLTL